MNEKLKIRSSQVISTYGVGSIIDIGGESFIGADISKWPDTYGNETIYLKRLSDSLGINHFKLPPAKKSFNQNSPKLPYPYFPRWMFCKDSKCRTFFRYSYTQLTEDEGKLICIDCKKETLSPVRFVACCKDGHLQEINWQYYVHKDSETSCSFNKFKFRSTGKGGGLSANIIECKECGSSKNLKGITNQPLGKCFGRQPWENGRDYDCLECKNDVKGYLRGGSQLYKPTFVSAIDIPTSDTIHSNNHIELVKAACLEGERANVDMLFDIMKKNPDNQATIDSCIDQIILRKIFEGFADESIRMGIGLALQEVLVNETKNTFDVNLVIDEDSIRLPEWKVLTKNAIQKVGNNFWSEPTDFSSYVADSKADALIAELLDKVVLIKRLREVRALKSFTRLGTSPEISVCRPSASTPRHENWLPALQVYGEGIFISFESNKLNDWISNERTELLERIKNMRSRWESEGLSKYNLPEPDPGFVMIHTLSHILIKQLCFQSGYQSASIRERIYYQPGLMQGVMIYTADSDAEGALGGLVKQGELSTLIPTIRSALQSAHWCSNDPVCINAGGQGLGGLNKGACHACSLAATTSCENMNALLDRGVLVGNGNNVKGYFSKVMQEIYL